MLEKYLEKKIILRKRNFCILIKEFRLVSNMVGGGRSLPPLQPRSLPPKLQ